VTGIADTVLNQHLRCGKSVLLGRPDDRRDLSMLPADKWQERTASADAVRCLWTSTNASERSQIDGARIEGVLDLSAVSSKHAVVLSNCLFTDPIILEGAYLGSLDLSGSTFLAGVRAKNLRCDGLIMRDVVAKDCIDLRCAEISGSLEFQDADFQDKSLDSLVIRESTINRSVLLRRAHVNGAVSATGVVIRGALICEGMTIKGAEWVEGEIDRFGEPRGPDPGATRVAFVLNFASIDGPVRMGRSSPTKSFDASGLVSMYGAHMAALSCEGASLNSADSLCLNLERAVIANSVFLRKGFKAEGTIRLFAAEVGDALEMDGAVLSASSGLVLSAERVHVAGPVMLRNKFSAEGCVRFSSATIGSFVDCSDALFHKASSQPTQLKRPFYEIPVGDVALSFERADIGGDLRLNRGFHAIGRVTLNRSRVKGSLVFGGNSSAEIENDGYAIDAFALTAGQAIVLRRATLRGIIDMRHASCTVLEDEIASWPPLVFNSEKISPKENPANRIPSGYPWMRPHTHSREVLVYKSGAFLDGLTYDVLQSRDFAWKQRRLIFKRTIDCNRPQPYLQLAKIYSQAGAAGTAQKVNVARLNAANHPLKPSRWLLQPPDRIWIQTA
jgi:hypothetical protein